MSSPPTIDIIDATECSLVLKIDKPPEGATVQYIDYGDSWDNKKVFDNVPSDGGEFTIEDLLPSSTLIVRARWEEGGVEKFSKEIILDTGVPGCAGSSKKSTCIIL